MSYSTNNNSKVWYGEESVEGTAVTVDSNFGIVQSFNFDENNSIINIRSIDSRRIKKSMWGPYTLSGSVSFQVTDWSILKYVLGSVYGSGTAASKYEYPALHDVSDVSQTYDVGIASIPSITIEGISDDNQGSTITGAKCDGATISCSEGQVVSMNTSWTAIKAINLTTPTSGYTSPTTAPFTYIQGEFKRSSASIGVVSSVEIGINNGNNKIKGISSRFLIGQKVGQYSVTLSTNVMMSTELASTLYADFYGQTSSSGPIDGTSGEISDITYTLTFSNGAYRNTVFTLTGSVENMGRAMDVGNNMRSVSVKYNVKKVEVSEQIKNT